MKAGNDNLSPLLRDVLDQLGKWDVIEGKENPKP